MSMIGIGRGGRISWLYHYLPVAWRDETEPLRVLVAAHRYITVRQEYEMGPLIMIIA